MGVTSVDLGDASRGQDYDAAAAEYHASRARYIGTVTADAEERFTNSLGKRREPLIEEINDLTLLAHARYETYQETLKAYAAKAPGRVVRGGLLPPSPTARMAGVDKLYKAAIKTADEYREVENLIKKRKAKLAEIDWKLRVQIQQYGRDLIAKLETPEGLEIAFKRDPLLARAHARLLAAEARQTRVLDAAKASSPGG